MFAKESEMTKPASDWLKASGMEIKAEFVTPWGACDLVGLRFNPEKVAHRVRLKQTKSIGSITQAALLLGIPDVETGGSTTLDQLVCRPGFAIAGDAVPAAVKRLVADRFVISSDDGRLQKLNGWMPLYERFVAVELKRTKIEEAMQQALSNLGFADESYVGFPADVADRVTAKPGRWAKYFDEGVGLLGVTQTSCRIVIPARRNRYWMDSAIQMYCVDKFWDRAAKCS